MEETPRTGWIRHGATTWRDYLVFNTDHKVIGIQYLVMTFAYYLIGGLLAMLIRIQLIRPHNSFISPDVFDELFSSHGTIMIFLWVIPAFTGLANYMLPLMLGAQDMAFPKLNALGFWLLVPGGILQLLSLVVGGNAAGWSAYAPLNIQTGVGQTLWALGLEFVGFSSIFGAINFLVTIFAMRAPSMKLMHMPLFAWGMLATGLQVIVGTPVLAAILAILLIDRLAGTQFLRATGDPLLWQNLFWFYSHPAVYIMILPGFGLISEVIPPLVRKPIFSYAMVAISSVAIAFFGFGVWAHHMFTSGMNPLLRIPFMINSMIIAVPTGIKIFSWLATLWGGKLRFETPLLFALGFISLFVLGGLTGVFLASVPIDIHVDDTYFIVAHLHYVLFGGSVMCLYAGLYYWFPKITGRLFNETLGRLHFWMTYIGFTVTFLVMHEMGLRGMPRRVATFGPEFAVGNLVASLGAFLLAASIIPFLINAIVSCRKGELAGNNPWRALTLEWTLSSPPPMHYFEVPPVVTSAPYGYGETPKPQSVATLEGKDKGAQSL